VDSVEFAYAVTPFAGDPRSVGALVAEALFVAVSHVLSGGLIEPKVIGEDRRAVMQSIVPMMSDSGFIDLAWNRRASFCADSRFF